MVGSDAMRRQPPRLGRSAMCRVNVDSERHRRCSLVVACGETAPSMHSSMLRASVTFGPWNAGNPANVGIFCACARYGWHTKPMVEDPPLTDLIRRAQDGDAQALKSVFDVTYDELRRLARSRLSKGGRGTLLDTSALVHESYLRFANAGQLRIEDRQHFLRYTSHVMRSVVVDLVRSKLAERRGGGVRHVTLNTGLGDGAPAAEAEILRVHEAL